MDQIRSTLKYKALSQQGREHPCAEGTCCFDQGLHSLHRSPISIHTVCQIYHLTGLSSVLGHEDVVGSLVCNTDENTRGG